MPEIPECDLLLISGDICRDDHPDVQFNYIKNEFNKWCDGLWRSGRCREIVVIAGNHDYVFQFYPAHEFHKCSFIYLQDSFCEFNGKLIYGSPWSIKFGDWAFMCGEKVMEMIVKKIPEDTDILLTHGPPFGIMDGAPRANRKGGYEHTGSHALLNRVLEVYPKLHVFGHIHEGYGVRHWKDQIGETYFVNASYRNGDFTAVNKPVEINL